MRETLVYEAIKHAKRENMLTSCTKEHLCAPCIMTVLLLLLVIVMVTGWCSRDGDSLVQLCVL